MSKPTFETWVSIAKPGASYEYHRGHLARDVDQFASKLTLTDRIALTEIAALARAACRDGYVHLVQRRNGKNDYSYLAVAARR